MKTSENLVEGVLLDLGHDFRCRGTEYLIQAAGIYHPGMGLVKELYPTLAKINDTTAPAVERAMRHSIDKAWTRRGRLAAQTAWFGGSIDPERGKPMVGEYVARMARLYRQAEGQE